MKYKYILFNLLALFSMLKAPGKSDAREDLRSSKPICTDYIYLGGSGYRKEVPGGDIYNPCLREMVGSDIYETDDGYASTNHTMALLFENGEPKLLLCEPGKKVLKLSILGYTYDEILDLALKYKDHHAHFMHDEQSPQKPQDFCISFNSGLNFIKDWMEHICLMHEEGVDEDKRKRSFFSVKTEFKEDEMTFDERLRDILEFLKGSVNDGDINHVKRLNKSQNQEQNIIQKHDIIKFSKRPEKLLMQKLGVTKAVYDHPKASRYLLQTKKWTKFLAPGEEGGGKVRDLSKDEIFDFFSPDADPDPDPEIPTIISAPDAATPPALPAAVVSHEDTKPEEPSEVLSFLVINAGTEIFFSVNVSTNTPIPELVKQIRKIIATVDRISGRNFTPDSDIFQPFDPRIICALEKRGLLNVIQTEPNGTGILCRHFMENTLDKTKLFEAHKREKNLEKLTELLSGLKSTGNTITLIPEADPEPIVREEEKRLDEPGMKTVKVYPGSDRDIFWNCETPDVNDLDKMSRDFGCKVRRDVFGVLYTDDEYVFCVTPNIGENKKAKISLCGPREQHYDLLVVSPGYDDVCERVARLDKDIYKDLEEVNYLYTRESGDRMPILDRGESVLLKALCDWKIFAVFHIHNKILYMERYRKITEYLHELAKSLPADKREARPFNDDDEDDAYVYQRLTRLGVYECVFYNGSSFRTMLKNTEREEAFCKNPPIGKVSTFEWTSLFSLPSEQNAV